MTWDFSDYSGNDDDALLPLLISERSQQIILAVLKSMDSRYAWVDYEANFDDIEAEEDYLAVEQAFQPVVKASDGHVQMSFTIADGYYLYKKRLSVSSGNNTPIVTGDLAFNKAAEIKNDPNFGRVEIFHQAVSVDVPVYVSRALDVGKEWPVNVIYQGCSQEGLCYPPQTIKTQLKLLAVAPVNLVKNEAVEITSSTSITPKTDTNNANSLAEFLQGSSFGLIIGQVYQGGYYAGQISTAGNGVADFNLVIAPRSSGQTTPIQWKTFGSTGDPTSVIDGPANSTTMNSALYPAAQFCKAVSAGGYSDWYMPALNELEVCYYNLKPTTASNATASGINANAVPARASSYTSGTPAQTSATIFQTGNSESFSSAFYWSSTQANGAPYAGSMQSFSTGNQTYANKTSSSYRYVRAVRRVAV